MVLWDILVPNVVVAMICLVSKSPQEHASAWVVIPLELAPTEAIIHVGRHDYLSRGTGPPMSLKMGKHFCAMRL